MERRKHNVEDEKVEPKGWKQHKWSKKNTVIWGKRRPKVGTE